MRVILKDTDQKEFIKSYMFGNNHLLTAYIKNTGNDAKIKQLELSSNVEFTLDGKKRNEKAVLRFNDTDKEGMLYSYEYEFAGRKFAKTYVKDEYKTKQFITQAIPYTDLYKTVEEKTPLNPTLEEIWANGVSAESEIFNNFYYGTDEFNSSLYDERNLFGKDTKQQALIAEMFVNALKFDKDETINYELNPDEITFNLYTSKTR